MQGGLVFQEGKCIDGEYYIVAVYDDPASSYITFSAYELENDSTYTYPFKYSEFDHLFRFDPERINPANQDGRYDWVIKRLDFIVNAQGKKMLCLAQEPTPEEDEDMFDEKAAAKQKAASTMQPQVGGSIDAALRVKLLKELDTQDDNKLHRNLVQSEEARKKFLADLHSKRQLEQLKATQRLVKADEDREARLAKLDIIRQQQERKAQAAKSEEDAKKSTMAQLEVLMKQKEAQAIRRLIQEKDEQDRGMGRVKDAARQKRKMAANSAKEIKNIEKERANQLARKRDTQVEKHEKKVMAYSRELAEKARAVKEQEREDKLRLEEKKKAILDEIWRQKREAWLENEKRKDRHMELEEVRERLFVDKEIRRAHEEKAMWDHMREEEAKEHDAILQERKTKHSEYLLQLKIDAMHRAQAKRNLARRDAERDKKIQAIEEARMRKFRESQYLEQTRLSQTAGFFQSSAGAEVEVIDPGATLDPREAQEFQKSFEQQERMRRQQERRERIAKEEAKRDKVAQLGAKDPHAREIMRIREWREQEEARKAAIEKSRLDKELAQEEKARIAAEKVRERVEKFEDKQGLRRDRSAERANLRNEAVIARVQAIPLGAALPSVLTY